jgi:uncharacterized protein YneF (UPF0154 family)
MLAKRNILFGWIWILMGIVAGMILGMFVFNGPIMLSSEMMDYTSMTRRMLRLGHIAFFGLGIINWMYGMTCEYLKLRSSNLTSWLFIFGAVAMPLTLFFSAFFEPFKYAMAIPAVSIFAAVVLLIFEFKKLRA